MAQLKALQLSVSRLFALFHQSNKVTLACVEGHITIIAYFLLTDRLQDGKACDWRMAFIFPTSTSPPQKKTPAYVSGMLYPSRKNQMIDLVRLLTWVMGS